MKCIVDEIGRVFDAPHLLELFLKEDSPKTPKKIFRYYSDETIKTFNFYIIQMEEQIARALFTHQMLGTRISDTLTLRTDCLIYKDGKYYIGIHQVKTRYFEKPISDELAMLIQSAINYTKEKYGDTKYVFVSSNDPSKPFQYAMLKNRVKALIYENDIRDENGELLGFDTHLFRHTYGVKLADLHLDDVMIAKLLGHRGTRSVHHYRRLSGKQLAKETRKTRQKMDDILEILIRRWDGYEQVYQDGGAE